tara:strand:- start:491 stop:772 length:282 start_codon:yes stop_codon:yes gene_type:complete
MRKPKKTQKATKTKASDDRRFVAYETLGDMANDVRGVLKAIIGKTGEYSTQEASVVSKIYNAELTRVKLQIEVHKIASKSNTVTTAEVLSLNQ